MNNRFVFALLLTIVATYAIHGQAIAVSQISGVVQDATGAAVPGATVKVTQTSTGLTRTATTGADGGYVIPNLPVGPYEVEAGAQGFSKYEQKGIVLQVGANPVINPVLQVGAVTEQVSVTADAAMAETHDNAVSQVIDQQRIVDLPLNGRNATQLVLLSGAATSTAAAGDLNTSKNYQSQSVTISIAGSQINGVNYMMDGGDNNNAFSNVNMPFPFPDALQEFSVETSSLPARYGLHPGGVVNLVTKSGTNQYHGNVFEFFRNRVFNARPFFAPVRDTLKRNQFGGTFGGPIRHDKLFFFTGAQGTVIKSDPATRSAVVPTQAMLNGDFSCLSTKLGAPFTAGNQISPSQFNAQALALAKYLPVPASGCGTVQYGIPANSNEYQVIGRVDYNQSERNQIFGRYFIADYSLPAVFDGKNALTTIVPGVANRSHSLTLGDTFTISPNFISSFHATGSRLAVTRGSASNLFSPADVGINIADLVSNFITLNVNNAFSFGCGTCAPGHFNTNQYQVAEDFDLLRGSHQIAFGVNYMRIQLNDVSNNLSNGTFTFNGSFTGNTIADFLLGRPSDFTQSNPQAENQRQNYFGAYISDTWRVSRRLTVNAGLRWEPWLPQHDIFGRGSHFELGWFQQGLHSQVYPNAPAGVLFHGDPGVPSDANSNRNWNQWQPRVGLVLDPKGDGRMTIRASYGILYDFPEIYYNIRFASAPPFGNAIDIPNPAGGLTNPWQGYPGGNPFPQPFPPPKNIAFPLYGVYVNLPLNMHPTNTQQWNFSVQRQFGADWLASASYIGNKSTHVWTATELNPATYIPGQSTVANTNQRRLLYLLNPSQGQYYSTIAMNDDGGNSSYNGLLTSLQHRFSHGFTALANYTWSHCISDADFNNDLTGPLYQNPNNRSADRATCAFDHRHIFNTSLVAMTPRFPSKPLRVVASGWEVSGIFSAYSGGVYTVTSGKDNSFSGVGPPGGSNDRPNVVGDWHVSNPSAGLWFNPKAFAPNLPGQYGNAGRDIIVGPPFWNLDMGLMRQVPVTERQKIEFRAEAFNILNHANLLGSGLRLSLTDTRLGQITTASDPRILQFALKYIF